MNFGRHYFRSFPDHPRLSFSSFPTADRFMVFNFPLFFFFLLFFLIFLVSSFASMIFDDQVIQIPSFSYDMESWVYFCPENGPFFRISPSPALRKWGKARLWPWTLSAFVYEFERAVHGTFSCV